MKRRLALAVPVFGLLLNGTAFAEGGRGDLLDLLVEKGTITEAEAHEIASAEPPAILKGLSIGALAYIDYSLGERDKDGTHFNQFTLTRGYIK